MEDHVISTVVLSVSNYSYTMKILLVIAIIAFSEALGSYQGYAPSMQYHGPIALPPGYDKYGAPLPVQDTPEVAHAKAVQLAAVAKAGGDIYPSVHHSGIQSNSYEEESWTAPQTKGYSGVAPQTQQYSGIASHSQQYSGVASHSQQYSGVAPQTQQYSGVASHSQQHSGAENIGYHGPIALPPGYDKYGAPLPVQDTPEVAHAKAVQLSLIAKAGGDIYPSVHHSGIQSNSYEKESWTAPQTIGYSGAAPQIQYHSGVAPQTQQYSCVALHSQQYSGVAPQTQKYSCVALHSQQHSGVASNSQQHSGAENIRYHGPIAYSPGYDKYGAPLPVLETPEVSHTKAEHFHNYAKTLSNLIAKGLYEPDYTAQKEEHSHHNSW
ncbi:hypothetical protein O3M35_012186 [Rhynocoris fuscipes]|uniref:Uncharacterized protein n=1 Tax=Rhynocoris fuscipes TaxID=488301 RepID=A0AAW1CU22_9HEMI